MSEQSNITKPKKGFFSIIFWIALTIFAYFSFQYLLSEWSYKQAKKQAKSQFSNIESKIYETNESNKVGESINQEPKPDNSSINQSEILLKHQLQISELKSNYDALRLDLERLRVSDNLPKIILSFIRLKDMIDFKMNYNQELQKLELLTNKDQNLVSKIEKLKLVLQKQPKNRRELFVEFNDLIPKILNKEIAVQNGLIGRMKENIAKLIIIKKVGEESKSGLEVSIANIQNFIDSEQYDRALLALRNIDGRYQEILLPIKFDLENANNLQLISGDIYRYLEVLNNNSEQRSQ